MTSLRAAATPATSRTIVLALVLLASGLAGCDSGPSVPVSPSPPPVSVAPRPAQAGLRAVLVQASLSGVVSEATTTGLTPVAEVEMYCDACGEFGHTFARTDASGAYDFGPGGIWVDASGVITLLVRKDGYDDPLARPTSSWQSRLVGIDGDTRFDIHLVRR